MKENIAYNYFETTEAVDSITCEVTTDRGLINEYSMLRCECYQERLGLKNFDGSVDEYDLYGHIMVMKKNNELIGGARIVLSSEHKLPMEEESFTLTEHIPNLENSTYCEFSRLAMKEGYRNREYLVLMTKLMVEYALKMGCGYIFAIAPQIQARNYRIIFRKLGLNYEILNSVNIPHKATYKHLNTAGIVLAMSKL